MPSPWSNPPIDNSVPEARSEADDTIRIYVHPVDFDRVLHHLDKVVDAMDEAARSEAVEVFGKDIEIFDFDAMRSTFEAFGSGFKARFRPDVTAPMNYARAVSDNGYFQEIKLIELFKSLEDPRKMSIDVRAFRKMLINSFMESIINV